MFRALRIILSPSSSSSTPLVGLNLSHSPSFFSSGKVSKELSKDNCLVLLLLSSSSRNSSIKSSKLVILGGGFFTKNDDSPFFALKSKKHN